MGVNFLFFTPLWALYTPDLLSPMMVSRSWYQDLGTKIYGEPERRSLSVCRGARGAAGPPPGGLGGWKPPSNAGGLGGGSPPGMRGVWGAAAPQENQFMVGPYGPMWAHARAIWKMGFH